MLFEQLGEEQRVFRREPFELDHARIAALFEVSALVQDVGDAAAHAGCEVAAGATEDRHVSAGHVLAAMVTHALDDRRCAAVANAEALTTATVEEGAPAGRAVQRGVTDNDVLFGLEISSACWADGEDSARHALA